MLEDSIEGNVLRNHLNVLHSARIAFMKCEADTKIKRALRHNVRNFSQNVVIGDMVYYKRNDKKWKGPGKIIGKDGAKIFLVAQGGLTYRVEGNAIVKVGEEFSPDIHEVKEKEQLVPKVMDNGVSEANKNAAVSEEIQSVVENNEETIVNTEDEQSITGATNNNNSLTKQRVVLKKNEKIRFKETEDEGWKEGTVLQRAGKATGKYDGYYNIQLNNHSKDIIVIDMHNVPEWDKIDSFSTLSDEETAWVVFVPKEKLKDKEVVEARMKQLNDWKLFDVYEEVDDCGQEKIRGGWIDVYKKVDGEVVVKSRFVARGYMEDVHIRSDSPTVRKDNIRLICMIAAVNGWRLETKDYRSAFLQGTEIDRQLFMEPPEEEKKPGVIWRLKKAVYGLNDASRKWWQKCSMELKNLGCIESLYDPALFLYFNSEGKLAGIICLHVDDKLGCGGNDDFLCNVWNKLDEIFVVGKTESDNEFKYIGLNIKQDNEKITIDQKHYIDRLELISNEQLKECIIREGDDETVNAVGQSLFRAKVGALNWLSTQTRPDIAYDVMELSTQFNRATLKNLKDVNKCIKKVKKEEVYVKFPKMDGNVEQWSIVTYSDGAFANFPDKVMSCGGHIVFIQDNQGKSCPITWSVNKIRRVVRSSLASEALTQQEAIEDSLFVREMLGEIFGDKVQTMKVKAITDSKSLHDAIHSTSLVRDKMLRIDIASIKQSMEKFSVIIKWKAGSKMIADALSKKHSNKEILQRAVMMGCIDI